jgi:hypothetical protein
VNPSTIVGTPMRATASSVAERIPSLGLDVGRLQTVGRGKRNHRTHDVVPENRTPLSTVAPVAR